MHCWHSTVSNGCGQGLLRRLTSALCLQNLARGRGLFCRSIMKSQLASITFTPVFAALVAVINTKFPEIGELLLHRVGWQVSLRLFTLAYLPNPLHSLSAYAQHELLPWFAVFNTKSPDMANPLLHCVVWQVSWCQTSSVELLSHPPSACTQPSICCFWYCVPRELSWQAAAAMCKKA